MPNRRDVVTEQLQELADSAENLWKALTRDPKKEARRERMWTITSGVVAAGATIVSRKIAAKVWPILTGEQPPTARPQPRSAPPTARSEDETRTHVTTAS
jgi:hypothetical protein